MKTTHGPFYGRQPELERLSELWEKETSSLVTCRGRRRVGKSTLVEEFAARTANRFFRFEGLPPRPGMDDRKQREAFCADLAAQSHLPKVVVETWSEAFALLDGALPDKGRTVVLLDEISWLGGYDPDFATAVTITSSCEGLLVPPSHNMVIFATSAGGVSVGALFMAGYVPGALLAIALMVGSYIISVKRNYPKGAPFSIKNFIKQIGQSIWALLAVLIVVVGVVGGVFTATESAAIAVIYSLIVSVYIYRGLNWKGVWKCLEQCIDTLAIVLILISLSGAFGYCLTNLHVPAKAATFITSISSNRTVVILLLNLIILFLGMIMDMAPIILIATPILLPVAMEMGIHPVQFGIMMVLNCGIGLLTPPVGAVLFIGSAVAKRPMEKVVKATLPFYLCMIIALILISFIPDISLWLPRLTGSL